MWYYYWNITILHHRQTKFPKSIYANIYIYLYTYTRTQWQFSPCFVDDFHKFSYIHHQAHTQPRSVYYINVGMTFFCYTLVVCLFLYFINIYSIYPCRIYLNYIYVRTRQLWVQDQDQDDKKIKIKIKQQQNYTMKNIQKGLNSMDGCVIIIFFFRSLFWMCPPILILAVLFFCDIISFFHSSYIYIIPNMHCIYFLILTSKLIDIGRV